MKRKCISLAVSVCACIYSAFWNQAFLYDKAEKESVCISDTLMCWARPGPLDAFETFDSSFSISSCISRRDSQETMQSYLNIKNDVHQENFYSNHMELRESNTPCRNILGSNACFSSSQLEGLTADR